MRLLVSTFFVVTQLSVLLLFLFPIGLAKTAFAEAPTPQIVSDFQLEDTCEDTFADKNTKKYISKIKVEEMSLNKSFTCSNLKSNNSRFSVSFMPFKFHPRENTAGR